MTGFEPATPRTPCVCATRLRHIPKVRLYFVGVAGFEPATSCSQSRRDNRATLYPERALKQRRDRDSNPGIPKDDSLAGCCITTLPPLQYFKNLQCKLRLQIYLNITVYTTKFYVFLIFFYKMLLRPL